MTLAPRQELLRNVRRIMVALGGNAIQRPNDRGTSEEMARSIRVASNQIAQLVRRGYGVTVCHGNGPQVGAIMLQQHLAAAQTPPMDLAVCVAESEGELGYLLQQELYNSLLRAAEADAGASSSGAAASAKVPRAPAPRVISVITQMILDSKDPAWQHPSKPIGAFMTEAEAREVHRTRGSAVMEDAGRGWRVCVPSPRPVEVVEGESIRILADAGVTVIAAGGGGVPVVRDPVTGTLSGREAVIDKDFASVRLARTVGADLLLLLTDVDRVFTDWATPAQRRALDIVRPREVRALLDDPKVSHFGRGSMRPKVEACLDFVTSPVASAAAGASSTPPIAVITSLERALEAIDGNAGTMFLGTDLESDASARSKL